LETQLADTVKARILLADGRSQRVPLDGAVPVRAQEHLYQLTSAARLTA
jgi:hypothetical protein